MSVQSDSDICNRALLRIGVKNYITSLSDGSSNAQACAILYPQMRDELLQAAPWPFATKHAFLNQLNEKRSGWAFMYAMPSDALLARYIFDGLRPGAALTALSPVVSPVATMYTPVPLAGFAVPIPFAIEASDDGTASFLLTDWGAGPSPTELVYTARIIAVTAFPPLFISALAWGLAAELSLAIPSKAAMFQLCQQKANQELGNAFATLLRGEREDPEPDSPYISVRG